MTYWQSKFAISTTQYMANMAPSSINNIALLLAKFGLGKHGGKGYLRRHQ